MSVLENMFLLGRADTSLQPILKNRDPEKEVSYEVFKVTSM